MLRSITFKVIYTGLMFLSGLVVSNLALPGGFGIISLLILNASLFSLVTGLGADSMIMHMLANKKWSKEEAAYFMWQTLGLQLLLFLLFEAGCYFLWHKSLLSNQESGLFYIIDFIFFTGLILTEKFSSMLYSLYRATITNYILCFIAFSYLILLSGLYYYFKAGFFTILFFFAAQGLLQGVSLLLLYMIQNGFRTQKVSNQQLRATFMLSSVVMITNIIQLFAYRIDYWLLKVYYSNYEVGLYAQASKFANLLWLLPNIITQLLIPQYGIVEKKVVPVIFRTAVYFNVLVLAGTVICTNIIYRYFLNAEYQAGLSSFYWMLPGYFCWAAVVYFSGYVSWNGKFHYNLIGSAACLILIVSMDLLLIPKYSFNGAAIANTIVYTLIFIYYIFLLLRKYSFKPGVLFTLKMKDYLLVLKLLK